MVKKILMVGPSLNEKGGISSVISNFSKLDFPIYFLNDWEQKRWIFLFLKNLCTIRRRIKKENIKIVHFHVAQGGSFIRKSLLLLVLPKDVQSIFHMHASKFDSYYKEGSFLRKYFIQKIFSKVSLIVAVSMQWKNFYQELAKSPVIYINNAVAVPKENCFSSKHKRIITLGRIGQRKGSYDIVQLAREVFKSDPEIHFELYGDGESEQVEKTANDLKNISFHTWINQEAFKERLKDTTLHLLPSYHEGLPMAVLETMALGIPNVTSDVGGLPSVIQDGKNGFLIKAGDINEMKETILTAVATPEKLLEMSQAAKLTIKDQFSLEKYHDFWQAVYHNL
ncbi:glycosyltransferase family 4 protein [Enterococcus hirae]